jgi:pyrroline-5-carboxylate reductase
LKSGGYVPNNLINKNGLVLLGCGKMGSALLKGWLADGINAKSINIIEPNPTKWLKKIPEINLNKKLPEAPAVVVLAVKPQMMKEALSKIKKMRDTETIFLSIAAGSTIHMFEAELGADSKIIRAMPNTPASVNKGITALIGNNSTTEADIALSEKLLGAVGQTVRLTEEAQMDAVTAISGSGPAYVFYLVEALAKAGEVQGLSPSLSMKLARATIVGAGVLTELSLEEPSQLRINVTSPGGTTQAALEVLMDKEIGISPLINQAVNAAAMRSKELGK